MTRTPGNERRRLAIGLFALAVAPVAASTAPVAAAAPAHADAHAIRHLINTTFDTPQDKVVIDPIVIERDHALADWIQAGRGGRALLRRTHGHWKLIACGGEAFRQADVLVQAGIRPAEARRLAQKLATSERTVPAARLARFDAFGPTVNMDGPAGQAAHGHDAHGGGHKR